MAIELHHFFILTDKPDALAGEIAGIGLVEGIPNDHPGQGTANRRFFLPNSTIEILYLRDADEASNGRASGMHFVARESDPDASPFGLIVAADTESETPPFPGWRYYPEYFGNGPFFHVGDNSDLLAEPLCVCMPPGLARPEIPVEQQNPTWIMTELRIGVSVIEPTPPLEAISNCKGISLRLGEPHRIEIVFNENKAGQAKNLSPDFPVIIQW